MKRRLEGEKAPKLRIDVDDPQRKEYYRKAISFYKRMREVIWGEEAQADKNKWGDVMFLDEY